MCRKAHKVFKLIFMRRQARNKSCSLCQASASCDGSVVVWNIEEQVRWPKSALPVCCVCLSYLEFSCLPPRRRWTVGLWCRRPMTSVTPSLCVGWPGSPGRPRWAPSAVPTLKQQSWNNKRLSACSFWQFPWRQRWICTNEGPGNTWALCPMIWLHRQVSSEPTAAFIAIRSSQSWGLWKALM